jgi:hypothetical protein
VQSKICSIIIISSVLAFALIAGIPAAFVNISAQGEGGNTGERTGGEGMTGGSDFHFESNVSETNTQIIARELNELSETEIRDYPLADLPLEDIKAVFMILDSGNLSKVLLNINDITIKNIYDKFTPMTFNNIIKKISESSKIKIHNRVQ